MVLIARVLVMMGLCAVLPGCRALRGADDDPAGAGPNKMLDKTEVGKRRCAAGKVTESPFVVEWDATDISSFEAKAARDLVFVRFEGCELEMVYGCSDSSLPGKYGKYESPTFTSGSLEGFDMDDEDEVYAKLPLGAANLAGKVQLGQTLSLQYFVSGVVNSTRNYVERTSLRDNPRCRGATHFVSAYNLGAFALHAHKGQKGELKVGMENAGGGARTRSESDNLKQGGKLADCESQSQRACRVPIRLVLQQIDDESPEGGSGAVAGTPAYTPPPTPPPDDTPEGKAWKYIEAADKKLALLDGKGCLADLEKARGLANNDIVRVNDARIRFGCTMLAGDCEKGKKLTRDWHASADKDRKMSDAELQNIVDGTALQYCPVKSFKTVQDRGLRVLTDFDRGKRQRDRRLCDAAIGDIPDAMKGAKTPEEKSWKGTLHERAVECYAEMELCTEALAQAQAAGKGYADMVDAFTPQQRADYAKERTADIVKSKAKRCQK
jgi:hypothetical protein